MLYCRSSSRLPWQPLSEESIALKVQQRRRSLFNSPNHRRRSVRNLICRDMRWRLPNDSVHWSSSLQGNGRASSVLLGDGPCDWNRRFVWAARLFLSVDSESGCLSDSYFYRPRDYGAKLSCYAQTPLCGRRTRLCACPRVFVGSFRWANFWRCDASQRESESRVAYERPFEISGIDKNWVLDSSLQNSMWSLAIAYFLTAAMLVAWGFYLEKTGQLKQIEEGPA